MQAGGEGSAYRPKLGRSTVRFADHRRILTVVKRDRRSEDCRDGRPRVTRVQCERRERGSEGGMWSVTEANQRSKGVTEEGWMGGR